MTHDEIEEELHRRYGVDNSTKIEDMKSAVEYMDDVMNRRPNRDDFWFEQRYDDLMCDEHQKGYPESDPKHCTYCGGNE